LAQFEIPKQIHLLANKGKGNALKRGFQYALELGYEYAITIDSDGQHYPENLPDFINKSVEFPNALIMGSRNMNQDSVPSKSNIGNNISSFWYWVETGIKLPDTQTGYRLYPIKAMQKLGYLTGKFEFEIEVIVKAAWKGIPVIQIPVKVYYPPAGTRVTHFRPFNDTVRITSLHIVMVLMSFFYYAPIRLFNNLKKKNLKQLIRDQVLDGNESNLKKGLSIALGIFIGIVPLWGYQILTVIGLSHLLKLNKVLAVLASNISMPPMTPLVIYGSYKVGVYFTDNNKYSDAIEINWEFVKNNAVDYVLGSIILATVSAILVGGFVWLLLSIIRKPKIQAE
jgi:uncharacterized protein (DUF2062 family)